ncbi:hypothetical protein GCK32_017824, partial [Trichostrongylus colubriformis]
KRCWLRLVISDRLIPYIPVEIRYYEDDVNYQHELLEAIDHFRPKGQKRMTYNTTLEREAKEASLEPYVHRFNVTVPISKRKINEDPVFVFKRALKSIRNEVTAMWNLTSTYQIGCDVNAYKDSLFLLNILCIFE